MDVFVSGDHRPRKVSLGNGTVMLERGREVLNRRGALERRLSCEEKPAAPKSRPSVRTSGSLDLTVHGQYTDFKLMHRGR